MSWRVAIKKIAIGEIDADTSCQIEKQILTDEIADPEFLNFAVERISELFGYLATGRINIRICRDVTGLPPIASLRKLGMGAGVVWGGVDIKNTYTPLGMKNVGVCIMSLYW